MIPVLILCTLYSYILSLLIFLTFSVCDDNPIHTHILCHITIHNEMKA